MFLKPKIVGNFQGLETNTSCYMFLKQKGLKLVLTSINFSPPPVNACNIALKIIRDLCRAFLSLLFLFGPMGGYIPRSLATLLTSRYTLLMLLLFWHLEMLFWHLESSH